MNKAAARLVLGAFAEKTVRETAEELLAEAGGAVDLAIAFASADYEPHLQDFREIITVHGHAPLVVGCTGSGLIGLRQEVEQAQGFSLLFLRLPATRIRPVALTQDQLDRSGAPEEWRERTGVSPAEADAWLALANPFAFDADTWLREWNRAFPGIPTVGGLASGPHGADGVTVFGPHIDSRADAVAVALQGGMRLRSVVSQGCRPIGEPLPVTRAEEHFLYELGSRPAYQVLEQAFETLQPQEKQRAKGNLFAGIAVNEYVEHFRRGDFLVRNILGADPNTGVVVLGAHPRLGQTLQYQLRDAESADADLVEMLGPIAREEAPPEACLLFCCNGRGRSLFGAKNHDAITVADAVGDSPTAGFFCNGEIGPVGGTNYIHGYTASVGMLF